MCGGGKERQLICKNGKIVIPDALQKYVLNWYHTYLLHLGINRTKSTIAQHFFWPMLRSDVRAHIRRCGTCQRCKKSKLKFGHLPVKEAEATPWDRLSVDLIGPYKIERKGQSPLMLQAVTMIDLATGWFKTVEYDDRKAATIADLVEQTWLEWYP